MPEYEIFGRMYTVGDIAFYTIMGLALVALALSLYLFVEDNGSEEAKHRLRWVTKARMFFVIIGMIPAALTAIGIECYMVYKGWHHLSDLLWNIGVPAVMVWTIWQIGKSSPKKQESNAG